MGRRATNDINLDLTAYHEAAHAVVGLHLGWKVSWVFVSHKYPDCGLAFIKPRTLIDMDSFVSRPGGAMTFWTQCLRENENYARILLAGPLAEAKLLKKPLRSMGARFDLETVLAIRTGLDQFREMLAEYADIPLDYRTHFYPRVRQQTRRILSCPRLWKAVTVLANDLVHWRYLRGHDVEETVQWVLSPGNQFSFQFRRQ